MTRFKLRLLASGALAAAALPALVGSILRAKVTDAGPSSRLVPIRGHGKQGSRDYLEFDPRGFAAHPGPLSLRAASGGELLVLGPPIGGERLRRTVERGDASRAISDGMGQLSGHLGESPEDFGFAYENVQIQGLPAWVIPSAEPSAVWVIHVHGLGSSRSQCLRGVEAFADLGYTSLLPSYRTSLDISQEPRRSHLGVSEWQDIEAARLYALSRGARQIVFVGWSLGASIVLRAVRQCPADTIAGLVLVSPALDWPAIISAQLQKAGCPAFVARWMPHTLNIVRTKGEPVIRWKEMPGTYMQNHPSIPTMIFHGSEDQSVPLELSRTFVSRQNTPVRFVEFRGAHHTLEWNSSPTLWKQSVQTWCRPLGLAAMKNSIQHVSEAEYNHGR